MVWENSKKLWKHWPAARVPTAFFVLPNLHSCFYLINRFHVAVRLFSNRSQMTSKCGKNKKVAHEAQPRMATGVSELISHLTCVHSITLSKNLFVSKGD